jgi:hypothetical protein
MVHTPKRSSVFGNRKLGDLTDREAPRKAVGNQNLSPGRYDVNEEKKKGTQRAFQKAQEGQTRGTATPVVLNPEKPDAIGQNFN